MATDDSDLEELRALACAALDDLSSSEEVRRRIDPRIADPASAVPDPCWDAMSELGWTGITIDEEFGGAGGDFAQLCAVLTEMGGHLTGAAVFSATVLATPALDRVAATNHVAADVLAGIASGRTRATAALPVDGAAPLEAVRQGDGWLLSGRAARVLGADEADEIVLPARTADGELVLALVHRDTPGLTILPVPLLDLTRQLGDIQAVDVRLTDERVVATGSEAESILERVRDHALVAIACDSAGAAAHVLDETVAYLSHREQFDRPIGSFQALKHRCADMFLGVQTARIISDAAATKIAAGTIDAPLEAARAKSYGCDTAATVIGHGVQLHGGIGVTWEHDLHLYVKRAALNSALFGSSRTHRRRTADLTFDTERVDSHS